MYSPLIAILLFLAFQIEIDQTSFDITNQCEFHNNILPNCYWGKAWPSNENTFRTNDSFKEFGMEIRRKTDNCLEAELPKIDFTNYTLLTTLTRGVGCKAEYKREIMKDSINKKIIYKISAGYKGHCEMFLGNRNWAIVPKIPDDYTIEYKISKLEL